MNYKKPRKKMSPAAEQALYKRLGRELAKDTLRDQKKEQAVEKGKKPC